MTTSFFLSPKPNLKRSQPSQSLPKRVPSSVSSPPLNLNPHNPFPKPNLHSLNPQHKLLNQPEPTKKQSTT